MSSSLQMSSIIIFMLLTVLSLLFSTLCTSAHLSTVLYRRLSVFSCSLARSLSPICAEYPDKTKTTTKSSNNHHSIIPNTTNTTNIHPSIRPVQISMPSSISADRSSSACPFNINAGTGVAYPATSVATASPTAPTVPTSTTVCSTTTISIMVAHV